MSFSTTLSRNPTLCRHCQGACNALFSEACRLSAATASLSPSARRPPSLMELTRTLPGPTAPDLLKNLEEPGCYVCLLFWKAAGEQYRSAVQETDWTGIAANYIIDIAPVGKKEQRLSIEMEYGRPKKSRRMPPMQNRNEPGTIEGGKQKEVKMEDVNQEKQITGHSVWFELVPTKDIEHLIPNDTEFEDNTGSKTTQIQISNWLKACQKDHTKCRSETEGLKDGFPTRLVTLEEENKRVKVIETTNLNRDTTYLTLSHRWGLSQILTLTTKNISSLQRGFALSDLPKTFQNALLTTLALGQKYLWIDSLCIIQDSASDWARESVRMSSIYGNSLLTIAACHASSSSAGCFSSRNVDLLKQCLYHPPTDLRSRIYGTGPFYLLDVNQWVRMVEGAPLFKRGWVVQERMLSRRMVFFCEEQVGWECAEMSATENFPLGLPEDLSTSKGLIKNRLRELVMDSATTKGVIPWFKKALNLASTTSPVDEAYKLYLLILSRYTSCDLTKRSDILPAISGIAAFLSPFLSSRPGDSSTSQLFLAGLWRTQLAPGLLWHIYSNPNNPITNYGVRSFPPQAVAPPTWSWASITGSIEHTPIPPDYKPLTIIVECKARTMEESGFGGLQEPAMLKLSGSLRQLEVYRDEDGPLVSKHRRPPKRPMFLLLDTKEYVSTSNGVTWDVSWDEKDLTKSYHSKSTDSTNPQLSLGDDNASSPPNNESQELYVTPILTYGRMSVGPRPRKRYSLHGLILKKKMIAMDGQGESKQGYVRVGTLRLLSWEPDDPDFWFLCNGNLGELEIW